jgi:hypothetical protein
LSDFIYSNYGAKALELKNPVNFNMYSSYGFFMAMNGFIRNWFCPMNNLIIGQYKTILWGDSNIQHDDIFHLAARSVGHAGLEVLEKNRRGTVVD